MKSSIEDVYYEFTKMMSDTKKIDSEFTDMKYAINYINKFLWVRNIIIHQAIWTHQSNSILTLWYRLTRELYHWKVGII